MTMRVGLRLDGDPTGAKQAIKETDADLKQLTTSAQAAGAAGRGMGQNLSNGANQPVQPIKLNQQQLLNLQFQMNDMATMLASGQSPFVMMMQQGMQVAQIFGPGASVQGAMRAVGTGIFTFLTNPLNLMVVATAVAAGGIGLMFDAFSGPEAKAAEDVIDSFDEAIGNLGPKWKAAEAAAESYIDRVKSREEVTAGLTKEAEDLKTAFEEALDQIADKANALTSVYEGPARVMQLLSPEIAAVSEQLVKGQIDAQEWARQISAIRISPESRQDVKDLADELLALSPVDIEVRLQGADAAVSSLTSLREQAKGLLTGALRDQEVEITGPRLIKDSDDGFGLRDSWRREQERVAREAEREAQRATRQAQRIAEQRAANANLIGDLEAEVAALGLVGDARDEALAQLKEEQQIRQAIDSLGEAGTAAEAARLQQLIPLRNEMLEASKRQAEQLRDEEQAARGTATGIASLARQFATGADMGERFSSMLLNAGSRLLESGLLSAMGYGASPFGGGPLGLLSLLFNAKGNVFGNGQVMAFANGAAFTNSVVAKPTLFPMANGAGLMGEAGPEAIMPLRRGPDGRLGVSAAGGGASAVQIMLGEGLVANILQQAENQSISIVENSAPSIAGAGASQGRDLAKGDYARKRWARL